MTNERMCVKCGRKGTRGFVALNANPDTYPPGREEWMCESRQACALRQIRDGDYDVTDTTVWTPDGGKHPREIAADALASDTTGTDA